MSAPQRPTASGGEPAKTGWWPVEPDEVNSPPLAVG